jgi:hypothetical protein
MRVLRANSKLRPALLPVIDPLYSRSARMQGELYVELAKKGSMYKEIDLLLLAQLADVVQQKGLTAQQAANAFDKFMTVKR